MAGKKDSLAIAACLCIVALVFIFMPPILQSQFRDQHPGNISPQYAGNITYSGYLSYYSIPAACDKFAWAVFAFDAGTENEYVTAGMFDPQDYDTLGLGNITVGSVYNLQLTEEFEITSIEQGGQQ